MSLERYRFEVANFVASSDELERKYAHQHDAIAAILSAIRELTHPPQSKRRGIGFTANLD